MTLQSSDARGIMVADRVIGPGGPCFVVAEIGINHNGDLGLARETIDAAAESGADSVKFQNFHTEDFISDRSLMIDYVSQGKPVSEPQYDLFKRCELDRDGLAALFEHCRSRGVVPHSTPTSEQGVRDLAALGAPLLKNGSDYLTHLPLVRAMGESGLPTVLSTGMATADEIDQAVRAFRETGNDALVLLHCVSMYPTPPAELNLRRIPSLAAAFGCPVGFSDHSDGTVAAVASVVLGACLIEKHFTLDRNLPGPDHRFSMDPAELARLVADVRSVEASLGSPRIAPTPGEAHGRRDYRLSCVAADALPEGHVLGVEDIAFRRPGTGFRPFQAELLVGRRLATAVARGRVFGTEDFA